GNVERILSACRDGAAAGAAVVCLPDLAVTGAPLYDLARRRAFIRAADEAWQQVASRLVGEELASLVVVGGALDEDTGSSAIVICAGGAPRRARDIQIGTTRVTVTTAAEMTDSPDAGDLRIVADRSAFAGQSCEDRYQRAADRARHDGCALAWANLVGGQDE